MTGWTSLDINEYWFKLDIYRYCSIIDNENKLAIRIVGKMILIKGWIINVPMYM